MMNRIKQFLYKITHKKEMRRNEEEFLKFFKVEYEDGEFNATADITDEDIRRWLFAVTTTIQKSFRRFPIIENYLVGTFYIGGQKIEFAFCKYGKEGPHEIRMRLEKENEELKREIERLKKE
ncbi:MAG: hypothetical protein AB7V16_07225 [Vulcanibacillus sp.]